MADVRLTATNPEDSSVVPVACNAKGELKLEEIPDQSFDGNLNGDLTVTGSGSFADGDFRIDAPDGDTGSTSGSELTVFRKNLDIDNTNVDKGHQIITKLDTYDNEKFYSFYSFVRNHVNTDYIKAYIAADGSAFFAGNVTSQTLEVEGQSNLRRIDVETSDVIISANKEGFPRSYLVMGDGTTQIGGFLESVPVNNQPNIELESDGSATFAGGRAGFTAQGYLWCTTRRGDRVILDATSNGMGLWEAYTPSSRREEIKDAWAEKNVLRPKPEESSQDETETTQ